MRKHSPAGTKPASDDQRQMERDYAIPPGLSEKNTEAARAIRGVAKRFHLGAAGTQVFRTPDEWRQRNEKYGLTSERIVVHDGGVLDHDPEVYEALEDALREHDLYLKGLTSWYSAVYPRAGAWRVGGRRRRRRPARGGRAMSAARDALIAGAKDLLGLTAPDLRLDRLVDPGGSPAHELAVEQESLCILTWLGLTEAVFLVPSRLRYVNGTAPQLAEERLGGTPWAPAGALCVATLESSPLPGDGLWWGRCPAPSPTSTPASSTRWATPTSWSCSPSPAASASGPRTSPQGPLHPARSATRRSRWSPGRSAGWRDAGSADHRAQARIMRVKVVPAPGAVSTWMTPPWASTMPFTM